MGYLISQLVDGKLNSNHKQTIPQTILKQWMSFIYVVMLLLLKHVHYGRCLPPKSLIILFCSLLAYRKI